MSWVEVEEVVPSGSRHVSGKSCLAGGRACPCKIEEFVHHMILFVKPPPNLKCMYMMPLGKDHFCVSPMRGEIYRRFGARSEKKSKTLDARTEASPP